MSFCLSRHGSRILGSTCSGACGFRRSCSLLAFEPHQRCLLSFSSCGFHWLHSIMGEEVFGIAYFMIALRHLHYTIRTGLAVCFGLVNGFFLSLHAGVAVPVVPGAEPSLILLAGSHWQSSLGMTCSDVSQLHFMDCLHPRWSSRRHLFHALSAHDPFSLRPSPSFAVVGL